MDAARGVAKLEKKMSNNDNGGAAFPSIDGLAEDRDSGYTTYGDEGMSLRDYFAAKAMQAILAQPDSKLDIDGAMLGERLAGVAFMVADAMIAERKK